MPELTGEDYTTVLRRFHDTLKPRTYLEIGVAEGRTLEIASCCSIGIDPDPRIERPILSNKRACYLFRLTSDEFFREFSPSSILGRPVDIAFLDGLHWFEFLLRDFIEIERHCRRNSIIFLHDCLPCDEYVGRRDANDSTLRQQSARPEWWAGDVWKVLAILIKFRPDLRTVVMNATPTGLVAVTHLDPLSGLLEDRYFDIIGEYKDQNLAVCGDSFYSSLSITDTRTEQTRPEAIGSRFWL